MNRTIRFLAATSMALAITITTSCSGDDGSDGQPGLDGTSSSSVAAGTSSSSSTVVVGSSSSVVVSSSSSTIVVGSSSSVVVSSSSSTVVVGSSSSVVVSGVCGAFDPSTHFCDERGEGTLYKLVDIDGQVWMAENLNYAAEGSKCGHKSNGTLISSGGYCDEPGYGRLYDWATAMNFDPDCNSELCGSQIEPKHQGICPDGWHIPTNDEWADLYTAAGGSSVAGKNLKAQSGWNNCGPDDEDYECLDTYGFAALPAGYGSSGGYFYGVDRGGNWWSASELNASYAYNRYMNYNDENAYWLDFDKSRLFSVRCLQD